MKYCVPKNIKGIYALWHVPSGRVYVGASTRCVYSRLKHHYVMLRKGTHATPMLQALWNESRPEDFCQIILQFGYSEDIWEREKLISAHWRSEGLLLNGSSDAARKRWSDPKYRESVSNTVKVHWKENEAFRKAVIESSRRTALRGHAEGTFGSKVQQERRRREIEASTRRSK